MIVVNNMFDVSNALNPKVSNPCLIGTFSGSSLAGKNIHKGKEKTKCEESVEVAIKQRGSSEQEKKVNRR